MVLEERFIAMDGFGRRSLFCHEPQAFTVVTEIDLLVYELQAGSLARLFDEHPELRPTMARGPGPTLGTVRS